MAFDMRMARESEVTTDMLELRKKGVFSNEYLAEENGTVVAELSRSSWRAQGEITVEGHRLKLKKHGALKDTFALYYGDAKVVEVTQPRALQSRLVFTHEGKDYEIRNKAWYSSTMIVESAGNVVGSVRPRGIFATGAVVELSDSLPLVLRVLIGWIAMVRWEEAAAAAS